MAADSPPPGLDAHEYEGESAGTAAAEALAPDGAAKETGVPRDDFGFMFGSQEFVPDSALKRLGKAGQGSFSVGGGSQTFKIKILLQLPAIHRRRSMQFAARPTLVVAETLRVLPCS